MHGHPWLWRLVFTAAGTGGYWLLYRPDWRNPVLASYDVPTLVLAFSFAGALIGNLLAGAPPIHGTGLVALLLALVFAYGAQHRAWPLSGHLTVALTVGIIQAGDGLNPPWLRWSALLPAVLLVLIRTFWPQSELMGNRLNTLTALLVGGLLGALGLLLSSER